MNFAFAPKFYYQRLRELAQDKEPRLDLGRGATVQVEFASVNPTGPLHVGHGRVAVIGDALARLHQATGFNVQKEYYVNDAGKQMENLGLSIAARYRELFGKAVEFPADGYPGDYVIDLARSRRAQRAQHEPPRFHRLWHGGLGVGGGQHGDRKRLPSNWIPAGRRNCDSRRAVE